MAGSRRIDIVLLGVAAVWGSSYLAAKVASAATPVLTVLFVRYSLSLVVCLPLVFVTSRRPRITRDEWRAGGLLGLTQAAVLALETFGVAHTSAANAGLIISLTIVLTPILDRRRLARACPVRISSPPRFRCSGCCCWCRPVASMRPDSVTG